MSSRDKAIETLKKLIREQKSRIDPKVLESAAKAADRKSATVPPSTVPYDKAAAGKAVELFLKNHGDAQGFKEKLLQLLKKNSQ